VKNKTIAELLKMVKDVENDPANKAKDGEFYLYTKKARIKLDKLARAINDLLIEKKKANGTYVEPDGYSGRQTNRRK
jgi:hypothetical protein